MTKSEAVLEQSRTLAAGLSPEERLSAIRTIAEVAPVASDSVAEEDVVADSRSHKVLLGRNVLNLLILPLDGPHGLTDILSRRQARIR
jgi:hypothetical protein